MLGGKILVATEFVIDNGGTVPPDYCDDCPFSTNQRNFVNDCFLMHAVEITSPVCGWGNWETELRAEIAEVKLIDLLRLAGCKCPPPLLGWEVNEQIPRCRWCGTVAEKAKDW